MPTGLSRGETYAERIEAQVDELIRVIAAASDAQWTHRPGADEWTAPEVCGHIAEMMPYWAEQAVAVANEPGRTFGRLLHDPRRVDGVRSGGVLGRQETVAQLRAAAGEACRVIRGLPERAWSVEGNNVTRGLMTVESMIAELVVAHVESHVEQVRGALGQPA